MNFEEKLPSDPSGPAGAEPGPVGWGRALAGTCRGTAVFQRLCRQSPVRALAHLLLLTLLLGALAAGATVLRYRPMIRKAAHRFDNVFGYVAFTRDGMRASRNPEKPRSFDISREVSLRYCPDPGRNPDLDFTSEKRVVLLWYPWCLFTVTPLENDRRLVTEWQPSGGNHMVLLNVSEVDHFLTGRLAVAPRSLGPFDRGTEVRLGPEQLAGMASSMIALWTWGGCGFGWWLLATVATLIFVGLFRWTRAERFPGLGYREMWVTALYASMPPLLIAAVWQALDLPLLRSDTVFILGFIVYFVTVVRQFDQQGVPDGGK